MRRIPSISLDYAVLERTANIAVTPASFAWSDLGNWASVSDAAPQDAQGNSCIGDVKLLSSNGVYCRSNGSTAQSTISPSPLNTALPCSSVTGTTPR